MLDVSGYTSILKSTFDPCTLTELDSCQPTPGSSGCKLTVASSSEITVREGLAPLSLIDPDQKPRSLPSIFPRTVI